MRAEGSSMPGKRICRCRRCGSSSTSVREIPMLPASSPQNADGEKRRKPFLPRETNTPAGYVVRSARNEWSLGHAAARLHPRRKPSEVGRRVQLEVEAQVDSSRSLHRPGPRQHHPGRVLAHAVTDLAEQEEGAHLVRSGRALYRVQRDALRRPLVPVPEEAVRHGQPYSGIGDDPDAPRVGLRDLHESGSRVRIIVCRGPR